jgi:hypothetical protein
MGNYIFLSVVLGLVLIFGSLILVILKPDINPQGFWIIRILVALGAGFAAAGILGNIEITNPIAKYTIKAGGPIALTVLFYLVNPPKMVRALIQKSTT